MARARRTSEHGMASPEARKPERPAKTTGNGAPAHSNGNPKSPKAKSANNADGAQASRNGRQAEWNLRLYVAGDSPRSRTALANLRKLCESQLKNNYDIEVIDLTKR